MVIKLSEESLERGVDQHLLDVATEFLRERWTGSSRKYCVVAAAYTQFGEILLGVATDAYLSSAKLCAETGPICEAQLLGQRLTACVCIIAHSAFEDIRILPPCGLCMERLRFFGDSLQVGVPGEGAKKWGSKRLRELQPFFWNDELYLHDAR